MAFSGVISSSEAMQHPMDPFSLICDVRFLVSIPEIAIDLFLIRKSSSDSELLQLDGLEQKFLTTIPLACIFSDSKSSKLIPVLPI